MTSYVENESGITFDFDIEELALRIENQVLNMEQCPYEAQINLLVTDLDGIQEINKAFRNLDQPTDVLSFPAIPFTSESDFSIVEEQESDYFDPESGELLLGDIMICAQKVKEQAEKYNHSEMREFGFLVAHSMLHLCGYDHMEPEDAVRMEARQNPRLSYDREGWNGLFFPGTGDFSSCGRGIVLQYERGNCISYPLPRAQRAV